MGFPTAEHSRHSVWLLCHLNMFDAWILPSRVVDPSKTVPDLNCDVQDLLLEVVDLKQEVPDLKSGGIPLV